jgi:hypothetical protein
MYDQEFEVELSDGTVVELYCYFEIEPLVRGVYHREPENCFPDEGGYAELVDAKLNDETFDINLIPKKEQYKICEKAYNDAIERQELRDFDESYHYRSY